VQSKSYSRFWDHIPKLRYPGKYEDREKDAKEVTGTSELFEGMRFDCQRQLSGNFAVTNVISMGSPESTNGAYTFNTNYVSKKVQAIGRYDGEGRVIGRIQYAPTDSIAAIAQSQVSLEPAQSNLSLEAEYRGDDSHTTVKLENKGVFTLTYMQSLFQRVSAGAELVHVPAQGTALSLSGRWTAPIIGAEERPKWISVLTYNTFGGLSASYSRRVGKRTDLSTEYSLLQTPDGSFQDMWAAGCVWNLRNTRIKARVDNQWHVGVVIEENITSYMRISVAADVDHKEQKYKFGLGMSLYMT